MDISLESQLEPLFFNFSTKFDFLTIITTSSWTWAAVLTAAFLSYWRVFHSHPTTSHHHQQNQQQQEESGHHHEEAIDELLHPSSCESCTRVFDGEVDGITKGKFTLYIEEDGEGEDDDGNDCGRSDVVQIDGVNVCGVYSVKNVCSSCISWDWEDVFVKRDLGWYSYQDLSALNGSVVKLWDGKMGRL